MAYGVLLVFGYFEKLHLLIHPDLKYTYCFYAHVHEIIKSRNKIKYMFIIAYEIAY